MGDWIPIFGIVFGTIAWVIVVLAFFWARSRRLQQQAEVQSKLIDRFGSTPELISFLNSNAGRDFVNGVQTGTMYAARERVLSGVRKAIILSFLGLAFIALWLINDINGLAWPGVLLLALGLGYFVATYVSLSLSKRFGGPGEELNVPREP